MLVVEGADRIPARGGEGGAVHPSQLHPASQGRPRPVPPRNFQRCQRKLASSSSNYKELAENFNMIIDHNDELTKKIEILEQTKATSKRASTSISKSEKVVSTS